MPDTISTVNTAPVAENDAVSVDANVILSGSVLADNGSGADSDPDAGADLNVLEVNGVAVDIGEQITLPSGALLTLNADGSFDYDPNGAFDSAAEGTSTTDSFTYTLTDGGEIQTAGTFAAELELSGLDGGDGFVINGIDASDLSGYSVASAGDVNGDGIDDLIIGAPYADPNGTIDAGESYVVFGSAAGFDASLDLSALDGTNGFVINGIDAGDASGRPVSSAGDVNGDGIDDLIIGARGGDPNTITDAGESYVVFGSATGFDASLDLSTLDGTNGFVINGIAADDRSGISVASAGDVNGDGIDDLIIGAPFADPNGTDVAGESYVVFGSAAGFDASLDLSTLDGTNGFVINGIDEYDFSGVSVSSAGDVNGDGIDDLIIGATGGDPNGNNLAGESYVVFGSDAGFDASLDLATLDGTNGFVINGIDVNDRSGGSVSSAGDVNGDGIDDLIIGAAGADSSSGESYVVFGSATGFDASLDLSALDGTNGFLINGIDVNDLSGDSVSSAGDVNGDGIDDLIIGARFAAPNGNSLAGESYVVFGSATGFDASLDLSALDGTNGFVINGIDASDRTGVSVSAAGDVNGDGIDDLIIGATGGNGFAGESYVIFGRADFLPAVDVATVTVTINGVNDAPVAQDDALVTGDVTVLQGSVLADNGSGADSDPDTGAVLSITAVNGVVASVGQQITLASGALLMLNADGTFDYDPNGVFEALPAGTSATDSFTYTLSDGLGGEDTGSVTVTLNGLDNNDVLSGSIISEVLDGGADNDALFGRGGDDTLLGGDGNDTLAGGDDNDSLYGGADNDRLFGEDGLDRLFGETGNDTLFGGNGNDTLAGGSGNDSLYGGNQDDRLFGATGNDTQFGGNGNDTLVGGSGNDSLYGGNQNDRLFGEDGLDRLFGEIGNDTLLGGNGNDTLSGGADNDSLFGGNDNDLVFGQNGFDRLFGDVGNDTLNGGNGNDTLAGGHGHDLMVGGGLNDRMFGENGFDVLFGDAGDDAMFGGNGNDTLAGGSGNDTLLGGAQDDRLFGNQNNDLLIGGAGNDFLNGGLGSDVFVFGGAFGNDTISGFEANNNLEDINLSAVASITSFADLTNPGNPHMTQVGANVLIDDFAGNTITLLGVNISDMNAADFIF
jgi:VCBS repeat-containing protein